MKVNKSIDKMLEEIEFSKMGDYFILQADNGCPLSVLVDDLHQSHHFLRDYLWLIEELLLNAVQWGNKGSPFVVSSIKVLLGEKGWVVRIRDSGPGFDYKKALEKGVDQDRGYGLSHLKSKNEIQFNYEDNGATLNLMKFY